MGKALLGRKVGMTRVYEGGKSVPVTLVQVGPCFVTQIRTTETDGYDAVQIGFEAVKPRNSTIPQIAHDMKAGVDPQREHAEFRCTAAEAGEYKVGQELTVDHLSDLKFVDVIGVSKGKGFAGAMKRHGFKGMPASHGCERKHRSPGSIAAHATNRGWSGKLKLGKRMPGHMGDEQVTMRSLPVVRIDKDNNLLLVKGPIPGANGGIVKVRSAVRLYKSKAAAQSA